MRVTQPLLLTLFVCLWLTICVVQGQECGENPMAQVVNVAKRTGRSLTHVLSLLQDIDEPAYETLARKFRMYAACVGMVDTGYFRKRSGPWSQSAPSPYVDRDEFGDDEYFRQLSDALQEMFTDRDRTWSSLKKHHKTNHKRSILFPEDSYSNSEDVRK